MATKNLSRTVIEGGRATRNQGDRYQSNYDLRTANRNFCNRAGSLIDPDDMGPIPKRKKVGKDFDDKLGPMYRWLKGQVGRKWDKVFSELTTKFDTRTVAGRHVVYSHLLNDITLKMTDKDHYSDRGFFVSSFFVDENGILCLSDRNRWNRRKSFRYDGPSQKEVFNWANCRKVMDYGTSLFWMVPERFEWKKCGRRVRGHKFWTDSCLRDHRVVTELERVKEPYKLLACDKANMRSEKLIENGMEVVAYYREIEVQQCRHGVGMFKQGKRLTPKDVEFWNKLTGSLRDSVLYGAKDPYWFRYY